MPDPAPPAATPPTPPAKKSFGTLKRPSSKPAPAATATATARPAPQAPTDRTAIEPADVEAEETETPDLGPYSHLPPEEVVRLNDLMEEWTEQLPLFVQSDLGVMVVRLLDQVLKNAIIENGVPEIVTRLKTVEAKNKITVPEELLVEWDEEEEEEEAGEDDEDEEEDDG